MESMDPEDAAKAMVALERQQRLREEAEARERSEREVASEHSPKDQT